MSLREDPRLMEAKAMRITEVMSRLGISGLRTNGTEMTGPCPICGAAGHNPKSGPVDRFNVNLRTNAFLCRRCGIKGGDQVALVQEVMGLGFKDALTWLCGDAPAEIDPAEMERRRRKAEAEARRQAEATERYRRRAISDAKSIWQRARPGNLGVVRAYLAARGIDPKLMPEVPQAFRFLTDHPYVKKIGGELVTVHRGPCMIAAIQAQTGALTAVHQTWVDRDPPHGKARITWQGAPMASKLVRGSKKGGAIRLATPRGAEVLVMGEGIETTLSAMVAAPYPLAAFWAGVDLGNMSGRQKGRNSGVPDMADRDAFVPPDWVRHLVFIQDGDSDPKMTRAKLEAGLKRAMALRPGLRGSIVRAGDGTDLNDVLNGKQED